MSMEEQEESTHKSSLSLPGINSKASASRNNLIKELVALTDPKGEKYDCNHSPVTFSLQLPH